MRTLILASVLGVASLGLVAPDQAQAQRGPPAYGYSTPATFPQGSSYSRGRYDGGPQWPFRVTTPFGQADWNRRGRYDVVPLENYVPYTYPDRMYTPNRGRTYPPYQDPLYTPWGYPENYYPGYRYYCGPR